MAIGFVQSTQLSNSASPLSVSYVSNNSRGNFLIAFLTVNVTGSTLAISDNNGNTWNPVGSAVSQATRTCQLFYAMNCNAGANQVTGSGTGSPNALELEIGEYSGI